MITPINILYLVSAVFAIGIATLFTQKKVKTVIAIPFFISVLVSIITSLWGIKLFNEGGFLFANKELIVDSLGFIHIALVNILFTATSAYMISYFREEDDTPKNLSKFKRYSALWLLFYAFLLLVLISNNIGLIWVALEATTIATSLLIMSEDSLSVEAMWKYILVCSIGIAIAFIGTVLVIAATNNIGSEPVYTFSELQKCAGQLNPALMLFAFMFIVVGYGTKSGLAPMHTWLPDAHSQAPTPVSAVFSGIMLNCALFIILRYLPIVNASGNNYEKTHSILIVLGLISVFVAVIFIPIQKDVKRLLAYCSVEHIGIIVIAFGLGGFGTVIGLLHIINHSFAKMLAFFGAGEIIHTYKTRDLTKISGVLKVMPVWGVAFLVSLFVLIGIAPSSIFLSEFFIVKTAYDAKQFWVMGLLLFGALSIFVAILRLIFNSVYGEKPADIAETHKVSFYNKIIIIICFLEFIILGLWLPEPFMKLLENAANIIEKGINL